MVYGSTSFFEPARGLRFSPSDRSGVLTDSLVSHAFEGGHIDHDACHVVAKQVPNRLTLPAFEFPLYWRNEEGRDVFQEFRGRQDAEFTLELSQPELAIKARMLSEYQTQRKLTSVFDPRIERFRPMSTSDRPEATWPGYPSKIASGH